MARISTREDFMFQYIKALIDKNDPSSTHSFLTIITVIVLLTLLTGIVISAAWGMVIAGVLIPLLSTIGSLVGVQSLKEWGDKFKGPNNDK